MLGVARKGSNDSVLGHGQGRKLKLAPSALESNPWFFNRCVFCALQGQG